MTKRTKTTITIQIQQRIVVRPLPASFCAWCGRCGEEVAALTPECAMEVLQITKESLSELLKSGKGHMALGDSSSPLICGKSLSANSAEGDFDL